MSGGEQRRDSVVGAFFGDLSENSRCLLVTHDMSEVKQWCDRILVMLHGEVIEVLEGSDDAPQHPYSQVLFDPWAGPIPDFTRTASSDGVSDEAPICQNGGGTEE